MGAMAMTVNGHGAPDEQVDTIVSLDEMTARVAGDTTPFAPERLRWELSFDRASIDRFTAEVTAERERLQAEIDAARARVATADERVAASMGASEAELGALVTAALHELERMERAHREAVASIRIAAETEAARILEAARAEADAVRAATASLRALVHDHIAKDESLDVTVRRDGPGPEAHVDAG